MTIDFCSLCKVAIAYRQLQYIGEKDSENNLVPNQQWRDSCSHILGKTVSYLKVYRPVSFWSGNAQTDTFSHKNEP